MKKILFVAAMAFTPCWAQEGVSQVTIAVKPQLFYSAEWTSPVLLRCASIGECAANAAANNLAQRLAAGERALSFQITNLRPSSQTLNGIPAGYLGDTELVSLNAQGEQVTSRWTGAWRASAGADCPNDGFDWRSVTESPIPNQVVSDAMELLLVSRAVRSPNFERYRFEYRSPPGYQKHRRAWTRAANLWKGMRA